MSSAVAPTSQGSAAAPVSSPETSAPAASSTPTSAPVSTVLTTSTPPPSSSNSVNSSPSSSASSSASTSSTSSAASSSTSSTKTSSSLSSSSSSKPSLTSSISFVVQTSNGQVFTQTSVVTVPAFTPTESPSNKSSTSFFHNTGAVAAVFSIAGIIALVVIFFLLTGFVRRRRARQLDREIDEAAAVAANAQAPDFDDFDYTSGTGVGYAHYSETSHGTYNQPPLSHERNNLGDVPASFEPYNNTGGPGAGAAGIGARGRSVRSGGAPDPFGALSNPPEQYEMNETRRSWHQGSLPGGTEVTTFDLLHAAGLAGSDPYAVTRGTSTRLAHNPTQPGMSGLMRSQSQGASSLLASAESYPMPTPAPAYPSVQDRPYPSEKARYSGSYAPGGGLPTIPSGGDADVYGGYQDQPSTHLDNPHSPGLGPRSREDEHGEVAEQYEPPYAHEHDEPARASLADDEDYGYNIGNRVLRVANE